MQVCAIIITGLICYMSNRHAGRGVKKEFARDCFVTDCLFLDGGPVAVNCPSSASSSSAASLPHPSGCQRRGSLQLWQFLVALLDNPVNTSFIAWTGRGLEFKLIEPEEVKLRPP